MSHESERRLLCSTAPPDSVESAAAFIAAGAASIRAAAPGRTRHSAEFEALVVYAQEAELMLTPGSVPCLEAADLAGQEHVIWKSQDLKRVFKATYPNSFGLTVGDQPSATPLQYFIRLQLTNTVFGDDIRFEGICPVGSKIQAVISQPLIIGEITTPEEIDEFMRKLGFEGADIEGQVCWYRVEDDLLAFDAHTRNFLTTPSGPVPIDVNVVRVDGELRAQIIEAVSKEPL